LQPRVGELELKLHPEVIAAIATHCVTLIDRACIGKFSLK
jgi:hypothetical protein